MTPPTPLILYQVCQPEAGDSAPQTGVAYWVGRGLGIANSQWVKLGERDKKSWLYWFYSKGEGLMDRIEYEEWALKGVHEGRGVKIAQEGETQQKIEVRLVHSLSHNVMCTMS